MELHPQQVKGPWKAGIVLDWHTVGSKLLGENEFGHPIFDSTRSEIGELLFKFKYRNDENALEGILSALTGYVLEISTKGVFDLIIPMPPSNPTRTVTRKLAYGLAERLCTTYSKTSLIKVKNTSELKSITDPEIRKQMLAGAFKADKSQLEGKTVLIVDDLYRSGATLEAATESILTEGNAKVVYVLAITRTRVHR